MPCDVHLPGRSRFLGQVPAVDLPALYRGARAFALASLYEERASRR
ncbi:MAG: hypothetical protein ABFS46_22095 [Myxococcota bacterium]